MDIKTSKTYREAISKACKNQKFGEAQGYLMELTPSNIRNACAYIYSIRNSKIDIETLNQFFQFPIEKDNLKHIKKYDLDKFRPVKNYLVGDTVNPKTEILELIAWLIDFQPRPYYKYSRPLIEEDKNVGTGIAKEKIGDAKLIKKSVVEKPKVPWKKIAIISVSILLMMFFLKNYYNKSLNTSDTVQCMVWKKTKYIEVSCNKLIPNARVIPIDKKQLENMKKVILKRSTIIFSSEGKPLYWYSKLNSKEVVFFTSPGFHPVTGKTLKAITTTIFNKYVPIHSNIENSFVKP